MRSHSNQHLPMHASQTQTTHTPGIPLYTGWVSLLHDSGVRSLSTSPCTQARPRPRLRGTLCIQAGYPYYTQLRNAMRSLSTSPCTQARPRPRVRPWNTYIQAGCPYYYYTAQEWSALGQRSAPPHARQPGQDSESVEERANPDPDRLQHIIYHLQHIIISIPTTQLSSLSTD